MTRPEDPAAADRERLRVGHADREQVIEALKDAFVQGRLTRDELDVRAGGALAARTRDELAALTADIRGDPAVAGPARPPVPARPPAPTRPSLVQRRPLTWAIAGSGSCLAIAFGIVMFAAHVLDPNGLGNPYHPWSSLCALVAFVVQITGVGILGHGLNTAAEQRHARRQLPPGGQGETQATVSAETPPA